MDTAFVITTHGKAYEVVHECISRVIHYSPKSKIFVFVNEGAGRTLELHKDFPTTVVVYIKDQVGGLTYTWNRGISMALKAKCYVIVLLNNDAYVNATIGDLLLAASNTAYPAIYGPTTTPAGAPYDPHQWTYFKNTRKPLPFHVKFSQQWHGLNGFCLAFHAKMILSNMYDEKHFFNPAIPFGGNETEWAKRWFEKGGECGIVESCFVHHDKQASWRTCSHPEKKVKVHKPKDLTPPKPLVAKPKPIQVAVVSYIYETDTVKILPKGISQVALGDPKKATTTHFLLVNSPKERKRKEKINGWEVIGYFWAKRDNLRLRLKHSMNVFINLLHQQLQDYVVFLPNGRVLTRDMTFLITSVKEANGGEDFDIGLFKSPSCASLMSHMDQMATMNSVAMSRFAKPASFYPMYSIQTMILPNSKRSYSIIQNVFDVAECVDWDFDFAISWLSLQNKLRVATIPSYWKSKTQESYFSA